MSLRLGGCFPSGGDGEQTARISIAICLSLSSTPEHELFLQPPENMHNHLIITTTA